MLFSKIQTVFTKLMFKFVRTVHPKPKRIKFAFLKTSKYTDKVGEQFLIHPFSICGVEEMGLLIKHRLSRISKFI